MKVTSFYPVFHTKNIEESLKIFKEDFGLEVTHHPEIEALDYYLLADEHGNHIDLVRSHYPKDNFTDGIIGMHVNVSDFKEGQAYFEEHGYSVVGDAKDHESFIVALLKKSDNDYVVLFQHKK